MSTLQTFIYDAQTTGGQHIGGTIQAEDNDDARNLLTAMQLNVLDLRVDAPAAPRRVVGEQDFVMFNQQLAHLTQAGLPVESGLRMIAQETRNPRMAVAVRAVADDLARGRPMGEAFEARRAQFPLLYGRLIDAGVEASNLPGMLFNIGRHMELVARLRGTVMRAAAYPVMVLAALALILMFLSLVIFPQFVEIFEDFGTAMPLMTLWVLGSAAWLPWAMGALLALLVLWPLVWRAAQMSGSDAVFVDGFMLPMPLVGPVLRHGLVARWTDTVRLGVEAGLDLPRAVELAGDALGSPSLKRDGSRIAHCLAEGLPLREAGTMALLPPTVMTTIDLASEQHRLPEALSTLTDLHRQQAETRLSHVGAMLMPILLLFLGLIIGFIVLALFLPLIQLTQSVM